MKEGPDRYINDFFTSDFLSSPRYRQDAATATKLMQMRLDSRGSPLRRTFLGNVNLYNQGAQIHASRSKISASQNPKKKVLSDIGANILTSNLQSGTVGQNSPRHSIMKSGDHVNSRNNETMPIAERAQAQTIRVDSSMKREPLASHKRNLTVGFNAV